MIGAAFLNNKPGTTKTTSAVFTAGALHDQGLAVLLVDADPAGGEGGSAQRWADIAGGFPFEVIGMARQSAGRDLARMMRRGGYDAVVADCPQIEDHRAIVVGLMSALTTWVVPLAPSPIELDRTLAVVDVMDEVAATIEGTHERVALLTRCNRRQASQHGPDAEAREVLTARGLRVLDDQVQHNDRLYRQSYGEVPDAAGTAYETLALDLMARASVPHA